MQNLYLKLFFNKNNTLGNCKKIMVLMCKNT
jgi:hypothetical protein